MSTQTPTVVIACAESDNSTTHPVHIIQGGEPCYAVVLNRTLRVGTPIGRHTPCVVMCKQTGDDLRYALGNNTAWPLGADDIVRIYETTTERLSDDDPAANINMLVPTASNVITISAATLEALCFATCLQLMDASWPY